MPKAKLEGRLAYRDGKGIGDNPYAKGIDPQQPEADQWYAGYVAQKMNVPDVNPLPPGAAYRYAIARSLLQRAANKLQDYCERDMNDALALEIHEFLNSDPTAR